VVDVVGAGILESPPHAVGGFVVPDPLEAASLPVSIRSASEPDSVEVEPDVTTSACAPPALGVSADAALMDGGGTVRSLWQ
jgi:hypothetical protein